MTKDAYPALFHYIHKAMHDIDYPTTKEAILLLAGDRRIHVDWDRTIPFRDLVEPVDLEDYSCAAEFYCALIASFN